MGRIRKHNSLKSYKLHFYGTYIFIAKRNNNNNFSLELLEMTFYITKNVIGTNIILTNRVE